VKVPETRYATTEDGVSVAYQIVGEGPTDLAVDLGIVGNVEVLWTFEPVAGFLERLFAFSRLIFHDRRGTGLSGGGSSLPDLETRSRDLLSVLDACRSPRTALFGATTGGAALAMFAATYPERVSSLAWFGPLARTSWSPEYPWGETAQEQRLFVSQMREKFGTIEIEYDYLASNVPTRAKDEALAKELARIDRHFMAPSTAAEFARTWNETDVSEALGALRCPTLLIDREAGPFGPDEAKHVQTLIPEAALTLLPGDDFSMFFGDREAVIETVREFLGIERPVTVPDTILATVLFTDIVGSTERQAKLGDHVWKDVVQRHHAIVRAALTRWHGVENDTAGDGFYATFDGPARAIRCGMDIGERLRDLGIEIRSGVHTGECELMDGKPGGIAVTTGSRISGLAGPSEVLVSQTVKDLVAGSGLAFEDTGEHELKGVPGRWHLHRVVDG
jgi:class 3 adenylate cyclase